MRQASQSLKCACVPGPASVPALFAVGLGPSVSRYCCTCSITLLPGGSPSLTCPSCPQVSLFFPYWEEDYMDICLYEFNYFIIV